MDDSVLKHFLSQHPFKELPKDKPDGPTYLLTCPVRMAFACLDKPAADDNGKLWFKASFIIPEAADVSILKAVYVRLMNERFGADWAKTLVKADGTSSITGGIKKQAVMLAKNYKGFGSNGLYFDAKSTIKPPVVDRKKVSLDTANGGLVYSGMHVIVLVKAYARPSVGKPIQNPGVSFQLESIQKIGDDEKFVSVDKTKAFGEVDDIETHAGATSGASGPAKAPAASIPGFD